ncbi:2-oxo acid dehydrogenase subunit E2 [Pedosphaera parvula]|nr:2-oxo acid dehydrogenase subunit E2 [Pedosphaera parvula]
MDVKLPNLGEGADSGTVVNVLVKEGDKVEKDQPLIELENEKAVASIPSSASGVVSKIFVKSGDKISIGARLVSLDVGGGSGARDTTPVAKPAKQAPVPPPASAPEPEPMEEPAAEPVEELAEPGAIDNSEVAASPSIRNMANDLGIDLRRVKGTARGGRIIISDVRAYIQRLIKLARQPKPASVRPETPARRAPEQIDFSKWGEITRKPMTPLRKVISHRMLENWNTIPHVTQFDEADVSELLELRRKYVSVYEKKGARLTLTSFILKAAVIVLKKHAIFNASLDELNGEIIYKEYYHIGIAVDTEAGLMVPVIRDVDKKDLLQLSKDIEELARKARDRKVTAEELKGGTFTISNQGGIGGSFFTPIVNKPEVAILGLGKGSLKPVARNNMIEPRMMLPIGLSYDHRLIDGGTAARFTVDLIQAIENFNENEVKV